MSFFHPSSSSAARSRRVRDSTKSSTGTGGGRRLKDSSKPRDEKGTPSSSPPTHTSPSGPPAGVIEYLVEAPYSHPNSPTSAVPPPATGQNMTTSSSGVYHLACQPVTPAALQKYLYNESEGEASAVDAQDVGPMSVLTQSVPDLKATHCTPEPNRRDDTKSIRSEPPEPTEERTPNPRQHGPAKADSLRSHCSSASHGFHAEAAYERAYTPPPAPLMPTQSSSPPIYMSPIPVRAQPVNGHFLSYQGNMVYSTHPASQVPESGLVAPMQNSYYPDYTPRYHPSTAGSMQRSYTQETNSAQRKAHRRSGSYMGADDDALTLLHRINSVLPDFHSLLERYDDISAHVSGEGRSRRQSETHLKDAMKEKDHQISKLRRDVDAATAEKERLQNELIEARAAQHEAEKSLLIQTKSRDNLREKNAQLEKNYEDMNERSKQIEMTLESFRRWTLRDMEAKERILSIEVDCRNVMPIPKPPQDTTSLYSPPNSLPGRYTDDSRTSSPSRPHRSLASEPDMDGETDPATETSSETPLHRKQAMTLVRHDPAEDARLRELQVRESWRADLEAAQHREAQLRDLFARERADLARQFDAERAVLKRGWAEHHTSLLDAHRAEKADWERIRAETQERCTRRVTELEDENSHLRAHVERIRARGAADRERWTTSSEGLKAAAARVDRENERLKRLLEVCDGDDDDDDDAAGDAMGEGVGDRARDGESGFAGYVEHMA